MAARVSVIFANDGTATAAMIEMTTITAMSSIRVNPPLVFERRVFSRINRDGETARFTYQVLALSVESFDQNLPAVSS